MTRKSSKSKPSKRIGNPPDVDLFFDAISDQLSAYSKSVLQYLAVRSGSHFEIVKCRLRLRAISDGVPFSHHCTKNIIAGQFKLIELGLTPADIVNQLLVGQIATPSGKLSIYRGASSDISVEFNSHHPEGLSAGHKLAVLSLRGAPPIKTAQEQSLDWELKANSEPFTGLSELASFYGLGVIDRAHSLVEVVAETLPVLRASQFNENGGVFTISIPKSADRSLLTVGYRLIDGQRTVRATAPVANLNWSSDGDVWLSEFRIDAPRTAYLYVVLSYNGSAHTEAFAAHPSNFPNPLRQAYEAFDPDLKKLRAAIFVDKSKSYAARDMEAAVSWLCWMHGFQVAHLDGGNQVRISDAPDLILFTPKGDFAIVECTSDILKAENKVAKLIDRAARLRGRMQEINQLHRNVLPVLVTSKTSAEISAERGDVEKLGVLVLASEELERMIGETIMVPEPQKDFDTAIEYLRNKGI